MTVFKCQKNKVHSLTLQYLHLNNPNKNLIFWKEQWECRTDVGVLPFNKFELPHLKEDNCCSWKVHSLPNHDLLAESDSWWYLQLISATLPAYRSTGTCTLCPQNMLVTFSSFFNSTQVNDTLPSSSVGRLYWTFCTLLVSPGWLLGWIHSIHPWDLLTLHQDTEPSTYEVLHRWIVHECRSTRPLFQIYTIRNWKQSMKNSFKHFIKHLKCKFYINPKNHKNNPKMFWPKKNIKIM